METYTWAAALAAQTEHIMLFSTSHAPTIHPIVARKQGATIDHISKGRWGLNIVCGWFTPEMEMFGATQMDHAERYRYAGEWIQVIKRMWTEQGFDHHGEFFQVKDGYLLPKPVQQPYPTLINAGFSRPARTLPPVRSILTSWRSIRSKTAEPLPPRSNSWPVSISARLGS